MDTEGVQSAARSLTRIALVDRVGHRRAASQPGRVAGVLDVAAILGDRASRRGQSEEAADAEPEENKRVRSLSNRSFTESGLPGCTSTG